MIRSITRTAIRYLIKKPIRYVIRNSKKSMAIYALSLLPSNYLMTSITTQVPFTQPEQVIEVVKNSGVTNMISGGLYQPISNGLSLATSSVLTKVGQFTESSDLVNTGKSMKTQARQWFDQGSESVSSYKQSADKVVSDLKTSVLKKSSTHSASSDFDFARYPDYYVVEGKSNIDESTFPKRGQIEYSELDSLGRTRIAKGSLTYQNVKSSLGKRESFKTGKDDEPSGWIKNSKDDVVSIEWLNGKVYNGYFYNRSHLIADQLGGSAIRKNAITGTRTQNVGGTNQKGGMRYSEIKATEWLKSHQSPSNVLYYSVEPVYNGNELVARHVIVKMKSSDGSIDETVKVFNAANGWKIDYETGKYTK